MFAAQRPLAALSCLLSALSVIPNVCAQDKVYINGTGDNGVFHERLDVSRTPSLYTGDFDDCLNDGSLFNVTGFDTAYYSDNLTVSFHVYGSTNIRQESVMMHLSIEVYGEERFNKTYDPCAENVTSLCPLKAGQPIEAYITTSISANDIAGIPSIALNIPDLEGYSRIRIFANSTQTEIGCFQATMSNGRTFSQPEIVGSILGAFTAFAVLASFATAIYGVQIPHIRMHYAHSFSILIIFETFQSIFFSGALSVNWPALLPAWWSNFAWTAGMFASLDMIDAISPFAGVSGNASQVGSAGSVPINNGGGLAQQIFGRSLGSRSVPQLESVVHSLTRRHDFNSSNPYDYGWAGEPRNPGMPLPGDYSGFPGVLSVVGIPRNDAFIIGLIWFLVILAAVALFVATSKFVLELCHKFKLIKSDGFDFFRSHWVGYMAAGLLRTLFIAFFVMMTLAMFQFSINGPPGPTAIAAVIFVMFLGFAGLTAYACSSRLREGKYEVVSDTLRFEQGLVLKKIPFVATTLASSIGEEEQAHKPRLFASLPIRRIKFVDKDPERPRVHQDEPYIKRYGWLSARYRLSRWWFFTVYLAYQFVRACFIGGGRASPLAQVYGLFVFELVALVIIIKLKPFEGSRNTTAAIWLLSISKIITTGLSIAFLRTLDLSRVAATAIGMIILVVQCFLAAAILVLIVLGMISSWMSLSRNREDFPDKIDDLRVRYFEHMEDRAGTSKPKEDEVDELAELSKSIFSVSNVRRNTQINAFPMVEGANSQVPSHPAHPLNRRRANSGGSSRHSVNSLPRSGRTHRASWSAKDFAEWDADMNRGDTSRMSRMRTSSLRMQASRYSGSRPPMTPTRESAEFPRTSVNTMSPEDKDAIVKDKIEENAATPKRRKRAVSWADQSSICEEPINEAQKVDDKPLEKIDSTGGREEEEAKPKSEP
ncbi:related to Calcium_related spray protein [Fusarium fujikuroi IMI 58289]|uniref:Related to Calcium_related spray protein n=1 Tax=Gibberella fujikuroi (strain CBS 195.34 / IMI 58289 / NRRL A-6831) TaxID=1279085 RepID=S0E522_GIBF5|nr:uncharacterized protein FFUJ_05700 [Fusarium fujikuroi IMI 58289]KLP17395.1 Calcium related spray protein [Fusarium fujikuroi]CCT69785.1 related to Calcium_related spray protein [Fusarium fujikuroi IMI 58289]SCN86476.1 related to Calcium_related spray protein [Fusarium fujikuroi]